MTVRNQKWLGIGVVLLVIGMGIMGLGATAFGAPRATILVNTNMDIVADDGMCSLREAVRAANANAASGSQVGECAAGDSNDTIEFTSDFITYTLSLTGANENASQSGDLDILNSVTIQGNGITGTILSGNQTDRIFHVLNGAAVIENLAITQGKAPDTQPSATPSIEMSGGGILNDENLTLRNVALYDNNAGSILIAPYFGTARGGDGGGIASVGTLVIENSTLFNNRTGQSGEGENSPPSGWGGAIFSSGTFTLADSTLIQNYTPEGGWGTDVGGDGGSGGAIALVQSDALIVDSILDANGTGNGGLGWSPNIGEGGNGGAGGGIYADMNSEVTLLRSTLQNNTTGDGNGGSGGGRGRGGNGAGIYIDATAALTVVESTLFANVTGVSVGGASGNGGGIYSLGDLYVERSTISSNQAPTTGEGGGVYAENALIRNSTIAYNVAAAQGGGGIAGAQNTIGNVILSNNQGDTDNQCEGTLTSEGYNLIFQPTCTITGTTTTNIYDQDAQLLPLDVNGGATKTHALNTTSPAIDAGNCFDTLVDQRGLPRFVDNPAFPNVSDGCDMGAYEAQDGMAPTATASPTVEATLTPSATPTLQITVTLVPPRSTLFLPLVQRNPATE